MRLKIARNITKATEVVLKRGLFVPFVRNTHRRERRVLQGILQIWQQIQKRTKDHSRKTFKDYFSGNSSGYWCIYANDQKDAKKVPECSRARNRFGEENPGTGNHEDGGEGFPSRHQQKLAGEKLGDVAKYVQITSTDENGRRVGLSISLLDRDRIGEPSG